MNDPQIIESTLTVPRTGKLATSGPVDRPVVVRPDGPGAWIGKLLDSGRSPDDLKALFELYKEEQGDLRRGAFIRAMAQFHAELPKIRRNCIGKVATKSGAWFEYNYADLPTIAGAVRPFLAKNGLSYHWTNAEPKERFVGVTCVVTHHDGHHESATAYMPLESSAGMSEQQKVCSATTFAQRNSLVLALGLTTTADDLDGMVAPSREEVERITPEQADSIESLIEHTGTDRAKFLAFYRVGAIGELTVKQHADAVMYLKRKVAK